MIELDQSLVLSEMKLAFPRTDPIAEETTVEISSATNNFVCSLEGSMVVIAGVTCIESEVLLLTAGTSDCSIL